MKLYSVETLIKTFGFADGIKRKKGEGTQEGLAAYFDIDQSAVSKWVKNGVIPFKRAKYLVENESVKLGQLPLGI